MKPHEQPLAAKVRALPFSHIGRFWAEWERQFGLAGSRELCLVDRFYLLVVACGRKDALHPWVYARCREVESDPDNMLDLWARYHFKSSIITFAGTVQEILRDAEVTACIFSHTGSDAAKHGQQIKREFETNELLRGVFPDVLWPNPQTQAPLWSNSDGIVVRRQGNPKEATLEWHGLIDSMPTGSHYRLRIYDDVVTEKAVTTPDQVAKATRQWELSQNLGMPEGRRWHIGTRYSFADSYQTILERGALKPRVYPATKDGTEHGAPVMLKAADWAQIKIDQSKATVACQFLQNPTVGEQAFFNAMDLRQYEVRPATLNVYVLCDPARSMKKGSANSAFAVLGIDAGRNKYLLDGANHRMDLKGRWEMLKALRRVWMNQPGVQAVHVGYEAYGADADLDYFLERMEIEQDSFPIAELKWPRDSEPSKDDRVQRLGPDFRSHRFYLPAIMSSQGKPQWWKLEAGSAGGLEIKFTEQDGLSSLMKRVVNEGQPYRIAKPIVRKDSEGNLYDLTRHFIEQQMLYPFAPLKDLIDAASRVYDMDPRPPVVVEEKDTLPELHTDGI
jgi:hypothetical protein